MKNSLSLFLMIWFVPLICGSSKQTLNSLQIRAADMSALAIEDCNLTCNRFKSSATSSPQDALVILASAGFNTIRLRVWVNPTPDHSEGNVSYVVALAKRASNAGLFVWIDFHLSDWWSDPGKQIKPALWANFDFNTLKLATSNHVTSVLTAVQSVSNVSIVQIGNEISCGTLWPEPGQSCIDSGALYIDQCTSNWPALASLISSGIIAARDIVPNALIAIHTDLGNRGVYAANDAIEWYKNFINALPQSVTFDAIALSYYMMYNASGPTGEESLASALLQQFPGKALLIAETSYPWNGHSPPPGKYPATPEGQLQFWLDTISEATKSGWSGVSWWGAEYAGQYGHINSLFDQDFVALPALLHGWTAAS